MFKGYKNGWERIVFLKLRIFSFLPQWTNLVNIHFRFSDILSNNGRMSCARNLY